jgi:hypothetical protein
MNQLTRNTGRVLIGAGICTGLFWALAGMLGSFAGAEVVRSGLWAPAQGLHVLGAVLALFGLTGLYAVYGAKTGKFGLLGFTLSVIGTMCFFADGIIALVLFPALGAADARLLAADGALNAPPVFLAFVTFAVFFMLGYLLFGAVIIRADSQMMKPVSLLMAGSVLANLPPGPVPHSVIAAGGILWSAGMIWLGARQSARQTTLSGASLSSQHLVLAK